MACPACTKRNWSNCAAGKYELSGGEQQRVSTARAITAILREISANGPTVIAATHALSLAEAGDRRLEMVDGALTASG